VKSSAQRKAEPVFSGVLAYFPDALCEVAACSKAGNDKHNPGEPLHWAKEKSTDETDACARHLVDRARGEVRDPEDNVRHLAKVAWRALAALQREIEAERARSGSPGPLPEVNSSLSAMSLQQLAAALESDEPGSLAPPPPTRPEGVPEDAIETKDGNGDPIWIWLDWDSEVIVYDALHPTNPWYWHTNVPRQPGWDTVASGSRKALLSVELWDACKALADGAA
jgi:hypothetical protein